MFYIVIAFINICKVGFRTKYVIVFRYPSLLAVCIKSTTAIFFCHHVYKDHRKLSKLKFQSKLVVC